MGKKKIETINNKEMVDNLNTVKGAIQRTPAEYLQFLKDIANKAKNGDKKKG